MSPSEPVTLAPLPMPLRWLVPAPDWRAGERSLELGAGPVTDLFADPAGGGPLANAPALIGAANGDFLLSARVRVEFASTFDAGVLLLRRDERNWAKLCFELSPQDEPTVVSVVTRGVSDDCNASPVDGNEVWLRIARLGDCFAFHASTDGDFWRLIRYFALVESRAAWKSGSWPSRPPARVAACASTRSPSSSADSAISEVGSEPRSPSDA